MSNLLNIKGSRVKIYKTLPSDRVGNDGDIILSQIQGRGVYLCSKVNGKWHVSSKMEELRKIENTSTKDLTTNKLRVLDNLAIGRGTTTITKDEAKFSSSLKIKEASNAISDTIAYGQLWVKTATPNELYFTTDAGNDIQLTSGTTAAFVGDITSVVAGDGLTGGGTTGDVTLTVNVDDSTIETNSDVLRIKDDGITYAKIQDVSATDRILGRDSAGAGVIEEITPANLRTMINVADGATANAGTITGVTAGDGLSGGGSSGGVSLAVNVDDSTIETNSDTLRVKDSGITLSKMADIADDRILGRYDEGDSGPPIALTAASVRALLNVADGATANTGDITGVTITTDSGSGSKATDTSGSADFSILGSNGVGVTNSGATITAVAVPAEIDHDSLNNFVANEHIDWTASSAGTIHSTNYSNTMGSGFTVSATTDSNATTITQGDDLMFAAGTGITCETTADGTVTISSTVTDTNTTYSAGSLLDLSTTTFNVDLTELTDGTADVVGSEDELVYLDNSVQKRKLISEIKLGQFNNDQSWTSNAGTVTSVGTTGTVNGLTLTGTVTSSGNLTLGGTLAINNGDWSGTDLSVANGGTGASSLTDNSILTGTGTSAITAESNLTFDGTDLSIAATGKIYLDGGTNSYIHESSADVLQIYAGGDKIVEMTEATTGNKTDFGTTGVGFTQFEPTYNASDTNVNFNDYGNKAFVTFGAGNITDMNLYFPDVSCNCTLLLKQDGSGSRTVTNWKTFDQADGNESTVVWAGGSAPTLTTTASKLDIISFYWDNDNHKAYGVASLNF